MKIKTDIEIPFLKKSRQSQKLYVIAKISAIRPNVNILSSSFLQTFLFSQNYGNFHKNMVMLGHLKKYQF